METILLGFEAISLEKFLVVFFLRDLAPFIQNKKREKHPWRSVTSAGYILQLY